MLLLVWLAGKLTLFQFFSYYALLKFFNILSVKSKTFFNQCFQNKISCQKAEPRENVTKSLSKHTTSFRCPFNVHNVKTTSYGCQNNVVCAFSKQ